LTRVSAEANGAICRGMLEARYRHRETVVAIT
jgi:hypothetical protein